MPDATEKILLASGYHLVKRGYWTNAEGRKAGDRVQYTRYGWIGATREGTKLGPSPLSMRALRGYAKGEWL